MCYFKMTPELCRLFLYFRNFVEAAIDLPTGPVYCLSQICRGFLEFFGNSILFLTTL